MKLYCDINLPASKSESNRALMIAAYGGFAPDFENLSDSNDTKVLAEALNSLPFMSFQRGVVCRRESIKGKPLVVDIADCGTAARFLTTYLACHEGDWLLTGTERMKQRPMSPLVNALRALGANIQYAENDGCLPLVIKGNPIKGGKVSIDVTQSSQFASSLLLAAPMWPQGLELELHGELSSLPYFDMTLAMLCRFSAQAKRCGRKIFVHPQPYQSQPFRVEPDWTAASYWYEMAALSDACEIKLCGLGGSATASLQGDTVIAEWMRLLGVGTFVEGVDVVLRKTSFERHPLSFDFSQHPDLYPTMAAICVGLGVEATFTGFDNLTLKESDRVASMQMELAKLGNSPIRFSAHNDHRIVMALAPLAMRFGPVSFDHPEVVEKSYPKFWEDAAFLRIER